MPQQVVLLAGPAGGGKSTLARAWCERRASAVSIDFDRVRELIIGGRADPQVPGPDQAAQYVTSSRATCALAAAFHRDGYDVTIDDVFYPDSFEQTWRPLLEKLPWKIVVIRPSLEAALRRGKARGKVVRPHLVEEQYLVSARWPEEVVLDTTNLSVEDSLNKIDRILGNQPPASIRPSEHTSG